MPASRSVAGVDPSWFGHGQLVVDLVYEPPITPFLSPAECAGARSAAVSACSSTRPAARSRLWTGMAPPLAAMWDAVGRTRC